MKGLNRICRAIFRRSLFLSLVCGCLFPVFLLLAEDQSDLTLPEEKIVIERQTSTFSDDQQTNLSQTTKDSVEKAPELEEWKLESDENSTTVSSPESPANGNPAIVTEKQDVQEVDLVEERSMPPPSQLPAQQMTIAEQHVVSAQKTAHRDSFLLPTCGKGSKEQRLSLKQREGNGIGYNSGYTSLDFFSSFSIGSSFHPFIDVRGHHFDNGKWAANAGLGLRYLPSEIKAVFGINTYYDYREIQHSSFNQIGAGLEILGTLWDLRLNGYFPVGDTRHSLNSENSFLQFQGHYALFEKKSECAFTGAEVELGRQIVRIKYVDLHATLGGYYFSGKFDKQAAGGLLKLTARFTPYFTLSVQASYDSLFKDIYQGEVALNLPFGHSKNIKKGKTFDSCSTRRNLEERLVEEVSRFEIIVTDRHREKSFALDPLTGQPLFFVFVDNLRGSSDGTFEHPFRSLAQAQSNSSPGNVIYVFSGDGTTAEMDMGITLQNNQWFIGSGVPLTVNTEFGSETIPAQTSSNPNITGPVNAVTLASDNITSGFNFINAGIEGTNISNTTITENTFTNGGNDIILLEFSGYCLLADNHFSVPPIVGGVSAFQVSTSKSFSADIFNNFFSGYENAIEFDNTGPQFSCNIADNLFMTGDELLRFFGNSSMTTAIVDNNLFMSADGIAVFVDNNSASGRYFLRRNQITNTVPMGILFENRSNNLCTAVIENNTLNNVNNAAISEGGVVFRNETNSTAIVRLVGNTSNTSTTMPTQGYVLRNIDGTGTLRVQSSNGTLSGVASLNQGTSVGPDTATKVGAVEIPATGIVIFTPLEPISP